MTTSSDFMTMAGKTCQKFRHAFLNEFSLHHPKYFCLCVGCPCCQVGRTRGRGIPSLVHMSLLVTTREVGRSLRLKNLAVMDPFCFIYVGHCIFVRKGRQRRNTLNQVSISGVHGFGTNRSGRKLCGWNSGN